MLILVSSDDLVIRMDPLCRGIITPAAPPRAVGVLHRGGSPATPSAPVSHRRASAKPTRLTASPWRCDASPITARTGLATTPSAASFFKKPFTVS